MGIQINGNNDIISALDGSWTAEGASINTSGILTATTFKGNIVGTAATFTGPVTIGGTLTYEDVTNIDSVGIITARDGIDCNGDLDVDGHTNLDNVSIAGVVTATTINATFKGDGDFVELDVDGHTNLDNVSIAGVTTFTRGSGGTVARFYANARESNILIQNDAQTWKIVNYDYGDNGTDNLGFHDGTADRLVIKKGGNIGINDTSPDYSLDVNGTGRFTDNLTINTNNKITTNSSTGQLTIQGGPSYQGGAIKFAGGQSGATDRGTLIFYAGETTSLQERVRIDSSGCVRVGNTATQSTSSNTKRIALGAKGGIQGWVSGQLNGLIQLTDNYYWDGSNNKAIEADHCAYLSLRSGTLRFGSTNSSQTAGQNVSGGIHERFRITSDGHVLFSGLTTKNDTRNSKGITIKSSSGGGGISFQNYGSNGSRNWRIRPDDMAGWGNLDFAVSPTANSSTDWPDHAHDVVMSLHPDRCIDTGQKTITGGNNLVIQNFRVKGIWSGSPSIGKSIEMISGYDGSVKMAAIGYNLTDTATGSTYGGDLTLHTQPLYSSPTTPLPVRMRVSSSGYVTTPQNPKFWYSSLSNTSSSGGTSNTEILKFATERHNQGSNYNTSNGRFTAPVAGTYWFSFNGLVDNSGSNSHYWAQLWRNGSQVTNIGYTFSNNGEYEYFGGSACIYLAKDDYAQIYASANIHDGNETSFSGFLIG